MKLHPTHTHAHILTMLNTQTADLSTANASEDDKLKAMMAQANADYDTIQ